MIFRAREFRFIFPRPALVMGIVNVTPDSFSDGGNFLDPDAAVAHALELAGQGAEILDIGGESTRPGARPVAEEEERRRVIPVVKKLARVLETGKAQRAAISIDTLKPAVARAALEAGASIVNDVAANRSEPEMWKIVAEFGAGYVAMHAPPGLHSAPNDDFGFPVGSPRRNGGQKTARPAVAGKVVVREAAAFFSERLKKLGAAGVKSEQVVLDPGIGFGKTLEQNLRLIACLRSFARLRRPLLLGASRKSFIGKLFGAAINERLPASLACAIVGVKSGAHIVRAHDVAETVQAIRMAETIWAN